MQSSQEIKKKKKKKQLVLSLDSIPLEELQETRKVIRQRLRTTFKQHIGKENSISAYELFEKVYQLSPEKMNIYKRKYWWDIIKKTLQDMRRDDELYVYMSASKCFVLQTEIEAEKFCSRIERLKLAMTNIQDGAREWVRKKKWNTI